MNNYQANVNACTTLAELANVLNAAKAELRVAEKCLDDVIDTTQLPVFGGDTPSSTLGIYSWDESDVLIYENEWEIAPREALNV